MTRRGFRPRALGEIAIRTRNIDGMTAFYRDMLGLRVLSRRDDRGIVFFRLSDGFAGHTAVLALFDEPDAEVAAAHGRPCITSRWRCRAASRTPPRPGSIARRSRIGSRNSPGSAGAACSSRILMATRSSWSLTT